MARNKRKGRLKCSELSGSVEDTELS